MADGTRPPFLKLGEIRVASDSDFQYFIELAENHEGWVQKLDRDGLIVWNRDMGKTPLKMFKVYGEFKDVSAATVFDTLLDGKYRKTWDENVVEDYEICRLDGYNDIGYYSMRCPAPLKNRDFVNQRSWRVKPDEEYILFNHSVPHDQLPPRVKFVRGVSYITGFLIRSNGAGCKLTYLSQSDPRGSLPKWVINFAINRVVPTVFTGVYDAASKYVEWKLNNNPDFKPWLYPEQNTLPVVDVEALQEHAKADLLTSQEEEPEQIEENGEEPPPGFDGQLVGGSPIVHA